MKKLTQSLKEAPERMQPDPVKEISDISDSAAYLMKEFVLPSLKQQYIDVESLDWSRITMDDINILEDYIYSAERYEKKVINEVCSFQATLDRLIAHSNRTNFI